jgi:hypothetical protein
VLVKNLLKQGGTMNKLLLTFSLVFFFALPLFAQSMDTAWVRRYNGSADSVHEAHAFIAVDNSGNVHVTGETQGIWADDDYATIKYYPNGDTAWVRRYNRLGNSKDEARAIAVDNSGNVYVTGITDGRSATIKYYPDGDTAWVRINSGRNAKAIAVDNSDNIYVTGTDYGWGTYDDYATIKYYPNGDTAWVRRYNGPGNLSDGPFAMTVDNSSNVYVTGGSVGSGTDGDYATIKYYPNGDTAWVRRYNGPANLWDEAYAIAVDSSGNVYVTGISTGSGTEWNYATIKYYPNGDTAWVRRYSGAGTAIALDKSGNVYVTGGTFGSGIEDADYGTIKYYPNGDTAWVKRYNGPGDSTDVALAIAVDSSGNVYVTGFSWGSGTDCDYATVKYHPNGDTAWVIRYNGPENSDDMPSDIAVDNSGNVYVTGYSWGSGTDFDYATIKYVQFLRGDCNKDGNIRLVDVILLADYVLKGCPAPTPLQSGDVNCDGKYDLVDVIKLARYCSIGCAFSVLVERRDRSLDLSGQT